jgi:hypothetical protein
VSYFQYQWWGWSGQVLLGVLTVGLVWLNLHVLDLGRFGRGVTYASLVLTAGDSLWRIVMGGFPTMLASGPVNALWTLIWIVPGVWALPRLLDVIWPKRQQEASQPSE